MLVSRSLLLSLCVLFLASCAKEKGSASSSVFKIPTQSLSEAQELAKAARVACESNGDCSPSVGLLSFAEDDGAYQCTAFLVSEDIIGTNSHCVPKDLRFAGAPCKDRMWMNFAQRGSYENQIECESVISASPINDEEIRPDYAFVKLVKKSARPVLRVSRSGFHDNVRYRLHKVDPNGKGVVSGLQKSELCRALFHSDADQGFFHAFAATALFSDCNVIQGNSGGPIVSGDGFVRGVMFGIRRVESFLEREKTGQIKLELPLAGLYLGTNFSCLDLSFDQSPAIHNDCGKVAEVEMANAMESDAKYNKQLADSFEQEMAKLKAQVFKDFKWARNWKDGRLSANPVCVRQIALQKYLNRTVNLPRPYWERESRYDKYLRQSHGLKELGVFQDKISLGQGTLPDHYLVTITGDRSDTLEIRVCAE